MILLTNNGGDMQLSNVHDGALIAPTTNKIQPVLVKNSKLAASPYTIPENFNTVKDILKHWNDEEGENGDSRNNKWRSHLLDAQKKRLTKMNRIVWY